VDRILQDLWDLFPFELDLGSKRGLASVLVAMYRQKGTAKGIENAIRFSIWGKRRIYMEPHSSLPRTSKPNHERIRMMLIRIILSSWIVLLFSWGSLAQANTLIACGQPGNILDITGNNTMTANCDYYGGFNIKQSNTTLDCQGSTLWGLPEGERASLSGMTGDTFGEAVENKTLKPLSRAITIQSSTTAISNIHVKNCKIKAFRQALRVKNEKSGARWFWPFVATDSTLSGPYGAFMSDNQNSAKKEALLSAFRSYDWESSTLPDTIRAVTPTNVTVTNVDVDLTAQSGVFVDHHVTNLTFDDLTVTRADGPGLYLEFGSRNNTITNSSFTDNNREGIAVDSSSGNLIQDSYFASNVNGGIFLYRNCWEHFKDPGAIGTAAERSNYFPRTQGSDNNDIIGNSFSGNGSTVNGDNVGVHVASRQSVPANFNGNGCGLYQMSKAGKDGYYHEDRAKNVHVVGNLFQSLHQGVIAEDDGVRILGNRFESTVTKPIKVGTVVRTSFTGSPVLNGRVVFSMVYQNADQVPLDSIVEVVEKRPEWHLETRVCSTFGRPGRTPPNFGSLCTSAYLQIMKNQGFYDDFQPIVKTRISEYYP